jgi:DNA-binding transcriptional regulator LsrR (DeoR family)
MSDLIISDDGPIRTLRMNRPAKKNALTLEMYDTMAAAMEESGTTAPMFAETKQLRDALVSSEPVRSVLEMARQVDMALLSAVDLSAQSKALEYDVITRQLWQSLRDAGAVGDICSHYLDIDGKPIAHPIAARTINPTLDDLRNVPELILAAGGRQKVSIIRGAILARLCHVVVTDEIAASALLSEKSR